MNTKEKLYRCLEDAYDFLKMSPELDEVEMHIGKVQLEKKREGLVTLTVSTDLSKTGMAPESFSRIPSIKVGSEIKDFNSLFKQHGEFSDKTFGKDRSPIGPINHLKKEVQELLEAPHDQNEYADCLLLLIDAFRRSGGTAAGLIDAGFQKLDINKGRVWGNPDENGVVEHLKS